MSDPHRKRKKDRYRAKPVMSDDYFFLKTRASEDPLTLYVMKDGESGKVMVKNATCKGDQCQYVLKSSIEFIESLGYKDAILRSDQEPAIKALNRAVANGSECKLIHEDAPVG